ncbi:hypothetical protein D3C71_1510250 [compost metagenome]
MAGPFADAAVRDDGLGAIHAGGLVDRFQLVRRLERTVLGHQLAPRDVHRPRHVAGAHRQFRHAVGREDLAVVFVGRADVDQHAVLVLAGHGQDVLQMRA